MLGTSWEELVERGRVLAAAPPLSRGDKARRGPDDPKWGLGDLLLEVPDSAVDRFASDVGEDAAAFRQYRVVAAAWPVQSRVAASWTAHRELKDHPARFELIVPGMTMRQAAEAAGKK